VSEIKRFAVEDLGIEENPSFTKIGEINKFYVVYAFLSMLLLESYHKRKIYKGSINTSL